MHDPTLDRHVLDRFEELLELDREGRRTRLAEIVRDEPEVAAELRRLMAAAVRSDEDRPGAVGDALAVEPLPPGTVLGRYRIVGPLDGGRDEEGGAVYRAIRDRPRRTVAIKIVRPQGAAWSRRIALREAEFLVQLDHPGIATVFDAGFARVGDRTLPYIVTQMVDGLNVVDYAVSQRLDAAARIGLLVQVCEAVHHAHQRGIIHRDLKPSNIRVVRHGGRPQVRILDFGVAAVREGRTAFDEVSASVAGTLPYMAPEALGHPAASRSVLADIYAIGIVAHELFSGRRPFGGGDEAETIRQILRARPPRLALDRAQRRRGGIPGRGWTTDLDAVIAQCLEKRPEARYASAAALAADLRAVVARRPIARRSGHALHRGRLFALRHRPAVALAAALLMLATIGSVSRTRSLLDHRRTEAVAVTVTGQAHRLARFMSDRIDHLDSGSHRGDAIAARRAALAVTASVLDGLMESLPMAPLAGGPCERVVRRDLAGALGRLVRMQGATAIGCGDFEAQRRSAWRLVELRRAIALADDGVVEPMIAFSAAVRLASSLDAPALPADQSHRRVEVVAWRQEVRRGLARLAAEHADPRLDIERRLWEIQDAAPAAARGDVAALATLAHACDGLERVVATVECEVVLLASLEARLHLGEGLIRAGRSAEAESHLRAVVAADQVGGAGVWSSVEARTEHAVMACLARASLALGAAERGDRRSAAELIGGAIAEAHRLRASGPDRWGQYRTVEIVTFRHGQVQLALAEHAFSTEARLAHRLEARRHLHAALELHLERDRQRWVARWETPMANELRAAIRHADGDGTGRPAVEKIPAPTSRSVSVVAPGATFPRPGAVSSAGARDPRG